MVSRDGWFSSQGETVSGKRMIASLPWLCFPEED
jgi:hypothetical protein